ncbi:histidine kinase [Bailinhaonella thermotolerans]|uniref:histidine kinase n=1 Tax=Bailinhaonella thermotolerans TaxID=1070861 RepID=A0A3A4BB92_9ACTN|nr:histidine kinase [Bailinhaonella thermotolerans]RJL31478.1 sensor histidine kinase [Bailinhaonella thermotolerans]
MFSRRHRVATGVEEATFATLHIAGQAAPSLRAGLTRDSARKAGRHLRALLGARAVAITSDERLLAWDGMGAAHGEQAMDHVRAALTSGRTHAIKDLTCDDESCPIRAAVVAPLFVDERVVGALAAYGEHASPVVVRTAGEVAGWVSGQLELAELDASRARALEAEMRALRAQISPHFVYNCLTAIASFVRTDPERARALLLDFADFARYSLRRVRDFTTLADELGCVDRYLLLERARFGDRLQFTVQVAPEVLPVAVPFLCVQPLVENAIRHGIEGDGSGHVTIIAKDAGPEVHIQVEDDGVGMDPERLSAALTAGTGGIGLANVDERLRQVYGPDFGLAVDSAPGRGTKVRLRIPKFRAGVLPGVTLGG